MRRDEYKRSQRNKIDRDVREIFETVMQSLGFDPDKFLDERGNWYVEDHTIKEKYPTAETIEKVNRKVRFENNVMHHAMEYGREHLRNFLNTEEQRFLNKNEIDGLVEQYMCRFVEYDKGKWQEVPRHGKWDGERRVFYATGWNALTKLNVRDCIHSAFAAQLINTIEIWKEMYQTEYPGFGAYVRYACQCRAGEPFDMDVVVDAPQPYSVVKVQNYSSRDDEYFTEYYKVFLHPTEIAERDINDLTGFQLRRYKYWNEAEQWNPEHAFNNFPSLPTYKPGNAFDNRNFNGRAIEVAKGKPKRVAREENEMLFGCISLIVILFFIIGLFASC